MGKSSEWFIKLKEQETADNVDEHVMYYTLYNEQDCDNSPNI